MNKIIIILSKRAYTYLGILLIGIFIFSLLTIYLPKYTDGDKSPSMKEYDDRLKYFKYKQDSIQKILTRESHQVDSLLVEDGKKRKYIDSISKKLNISLGNINTLKIKLNAKLERKSIIEKDIERIENDTTPVPKKEIMISLKKSLLLK
jgi:hypothetical protein